MCKIYINCWYFFHSYLYIKDLHDRNDVFAAREAVLDFIAKSGSQKLDPDYSVKDGILHQRCGLGCIPFMEVS